MDYKQVINAFFSILLLFFTSISIWAQCPELTSDSVDPDCNINCNVCLDDEIIISMTGVDMEDGSTIDFYIGPDGDDPLGETYLGSADVTSDCADGPQFMYILVDPPPGPDKCDEYAVIYTGGSGFDADEIEIVNGVGNTLSPYVLGNSAAFTPDCGVIAVGPGDFVPDDAILIIQSSAEGNEVYDITELCDLGLDIYVIASDNTDCSGGFFINGADVEYELELDCVSDIVSYSSGTNAWSFLEGEGDWITEVPEMEIPEPSNGLTTIEDFTFTITQDIIDDFCIPPSSQLDVQGYLNPQIGGACVDVVTTIFNLTLSCPEANEVDPIDACETDGDISIDLSIYDDQISGGSGNVIWSTNSDGSGVIGNPSNYSGSVPVYAFVEFGGCESDIIELEVNVFPEPNVDLVIDPMDACAGDDITILENGGDGVSWMWEGPGGFNSDDQDAEVDDAEPGTYSVTVTDANDCTSIMEIEYSPISGPSAEVDVSSEDLCEGSCIEVTFTITSGSGGPYDLVWEVSAGITIPIPWTTDVESETWTICTTTGLIGGWDPGTMTATVPEFLSFIEVELVNISEGGCEGQVDSDVITINIVEPPTANDAGPLTACADIGMDAEFDLSELNDEIGGSDDVLWFEDMDLMDEIDPPTVETDMNMTVFAVVDDGVCLSEPVEVELIVMEIGDAGEDEEITICNGLTDPLNLFGTLGGTPTIGGMWSDVSGAGVDLTNPEVVDFSDVEEGTYDFTYSFTGVVGCPESMATVTVIIDPPIEMEILSQECSPDDLFLIVLFEISEDGIVSSDVGVLMSTGGLSYQLDVPTNESEFTITIVDPNNMSCVYEYEFDVPECGCQFIPAPEVDPEYVLCFGEDFPDIEAIDDQDFSANWFDETGTDIILGDSEEFTPTEDGTYFVQTFDVLDPTCTSELVEFEVIVLTPPNPGMDSMIMMCQGFDMSFNLMDLLLGTPDVGGDWTDVLMTGLDISDPANVNFSSLPSGSYTFNYELDGDACPNASANLTVTISVPPNPGMDVDTSACAGSDVLLDFIQMISPVDLGGVWMESTGMIDLSTPDQVSIQTLASGIYIIEYVIPGMDQMSPYCASVSSMITLEIVDPISAGMDNQVSECIGGTLSISNYLLNNDAIGIIEPVDPAVMIVGDMFATNGLMEGDYEFYHIINMTESCPADTALITITLGNQLTAGLDVDEDICATGNFDLNDLLNGADLGGSFILESDNSTIPAGILDATNYAGQSISILYEIGGGSCPLDTAVLSLNIADEPSFMIDPNDEMICEGDCASFTITTSFTQGVLLNINLLDEQGIVVSSEMLMLNGNSNFDICNINNGNLSVLDLEPDQNYSLELVSFVFMGCEYDLNESIEIVSGASGVLNYSESLCSNQEVTLGGIVFNQFNPTGSVDVPIPNACDSLINVNLDFFDPVESFIDGSVCSSFSILVNGTNYNSTNPIGVEVVPNGASNSCDSTIFVSLDFSIDNEMIDIVESLCEGDFIQVGDDVYDESNPVGQTLIPASSQFSCDTIVTVELSFGEAYQISLEPQCADQTQGIIIVDGTTNNLPLDIFVDDVLFDSTNELPFNIFLDNGAYSIDLIDANGCTLQENVTIQTTSVNFSVASAGTTNNVYDLSVNTSISLDSVIWSGSGLTCSVCFDPSTSLISGTQEFVATGYYGDGCTVSASIILIEQTSTEIFYPNIFKPNNDGVNDVFFLQSESDYIVNQLSIFDRWGNAVWLNQNFETNDPNQGWDGRFNGAKVNMGVYVFYGEVEIPGEGIRILEGSITIVR